ncbi:MAG: O-antigen ligase family protein [Anaerolineales bacterium]
MPLQRLMILLTFLYLIFIASAAYTTNNLLFKVMFHALVMGSLFVWFGRWAWQRRSLPHSPLDGLLLIYVAWLFITAFSGQHPRLSLEGVWALMVYVLWFYIVLDLMRQGRERWLFEGLLLNAGVIVLISLLEVLSRYSGFPFVLQDQDWFAVGGFSEPIPPKMDGLALVFNVSTILGNFVAFLIPLVLAWGISTRRFDNRVGALALVGGLVVVLYLTYSEGAYVAFGVSMLVCLTFYAAQRSPRIPQLAALGAVIGGVGAAFGLLMLLAMTDGTPAYDEARQDLWQAATTTTLDYPVTGVGTQAFGSAYRVYHLVDEDIDHLMAAHNLVLNTLAETGLPGLLIILGLVGGFLRVWWIAYQHAPAKRRTRLVGILAALSALAVHSAVDNFEHPALGLGIALCVAYVVVDWPAPPRPARPYRWAPLIILGVVSLWAVWWVRADIAEARYWNGMQLYGAGDYAAAAQAFSRAAELDPELALYDLHHVQTLGALAEDGDPQALARAIRAYETVLQTHTAPHELVWANLAVLYAQRGDYNAALQAINQAIGIAPSPASTDYYILRAEYRVALGDDAAAQADYETALQDNLQLTSSIYWHASPLREQAVEGVYQTATPTRQLTIAMNMGWDARAHDLAEGLARQTETWVEHLVLGRYYLHYGEAARALDVLQQAQTLFGRDNTGLLTSMALAHWELGNLEAAETHARRALYFGAENTPASYVLAQVLITQGGHPADTINALLLRSIPLPLSSESAYTSAIFARPSILSPLPQMTLPGYDRAYYEPWLLLATRYAEDDDPETDPEAIQNLLAQHAPYLFAEWRD